MRYSWRCLHDLHNEALLLSCSRGRLVRRSLGEGGVTPALLTEAIAARNSDSRFDGRSTSTPMRCSSGSPFVAEPPSRPARATTSSATAFSRPCAAEVVSWLTPDGGGVSALVAACSSDFIICSRVCASSRARFGFFLSWWAMIQRPAATLTAMRIINAAPTRSAIFRPRLVSSAWAVRKISREPSCIPA